MREAARAENSEVVLACCCMTLSVIGAVERSMSVAASNIFQISGMGQTHTVVDSVLNILSDRVVVDCAEGRLSVWIACQLCWETPNGGSMSLLQPS